MTYAQTIDYLYTKLPLFSRIGAAAIKKDLHNTEALCAFLGHPEQKFKSIHVGGTNGKGSVSHMLAAVLQTAGFKTGLYTSPHLYDLRERIRINGELIPKKEVVDFVQKIKPQIEAVQPSFFEVTVAMAFDYFAAQQADVAVIEVGLGGRLDSTNVIQPELSVITNIGMDHMSILGNTLEQIAAEKAGIIKPKTPVVIGERHAATAPVFVAKAAAQNAVIFFAEDHFQVTHHQAQPKILHLTVAEKDQETITTYQLDLPGLYQAKNIKPALLAVRLLQQMGWAIKDDDVKKAFTQVKTCTGLMGRWEVIREKPLLVLDVAHNEDGIRQVLAQIKELKLKELHLVLGMVKDKDIDAVLRLLPKEAHYYFTQAHIPRALPAADLRTKALEAHLEGAVFEDVNTAVQAALDKAGSEDLVLVCGSIFLIAEVAKERWQKEGS